MAATDVAGVDGQLRGAAREDGDAVFVTGEAGPLTYAELDARVDGLAAALCARGVGAGDRVAIAAPNGVPWLETFFATARIGAILVTLNVRYRESELAYMLNQSQTRLLVTAAGAGDFDFVEFYRGFRSRIPTVAEIVYLDAPAGAGVTRYEDLAGAGAPPPVEPPDPAAPAVILYTSGTTGRPKGATLTQASLLAAAGGQVERIGSRPDDVVLATMPFNHVGGLTCTILATLLARGSMMLQSAFSPAGAVRALTDSGVSVFAGVPTMWKLVLDALGEGATLPALRVAVVGGSNAEPALCRAILAAAPQARLFNLYGLSESSGACVTNRFGSSWTATFF